jgi:hypothetical protein
MHSVKNRRRQAPWTSRIDGSCHGRDARTDAARFDVTTVLAARWRPISRLFAAAKITRADR